MGPVRVDFDPEQIGARLRASRLGCVDDMSTGKEVEGVPCSV